MSLDCKTGLYISPAISNTIIEFNNNLGVTASTFNSNFKHVKSDSVHFESTSCSNDYPRRQRNDNKSFRA